MKKKAFVCLFAVLFCFILPLPASANSAEPPCFTVVVQNPPADLTLTVEFGSGLSLDPVELRRESKGWEVYYRFNYYDVSFDYDNGQSFWNYGPEGLTGAQLVIDTGGETFSLPIDPTGFSQYNNLMTLNLSARTLSVGQPWWRIPLLVFLRVALTLLLDGLIFFLFGYRQRRSWLVFLLVNLVTQLGVNLFILFLAPAATTSLSIWVGFFLYTPIEILVLLVEMFAFFKLLRERTKRRAVLYAAVANLFSWALGGYLLAVLPL